MRGQLFIVAALIVCFTISQLANLYYYSTLPAEKEKVMVSDASNILKNIQTELVYVMIEDATNKPRIDDLITILENSAEEKNYETNILRSDTIDAPLPESCNSIIQGTSKAYDFNITISHETGEINSIYRVCWA